MTDATPFTVTYEQVELLFDRELADFTAGRTDQEYQRQTVFVLTVRDGVGTAQLLLDRGQTEALVEALQVSIAEQDEWQNTRMTNAAIAGQENQ